MSAAPLFFCLQCSSSGAGEAPVQPIEFNHRIHAGENSIPCLYCHAYARRSTVAGIPSVSRCMGCHKITANDKPGVQELTSLFQDGKPVEWIRVYNVPDYVYFSHKRHVVKGVDCSECHGNVEQMDRVYSVRSFSMGWCLDCHRENGAGVDCLICHK